MILVTGGAGFIGSNIVGTLCDRGAPVTVCDRLRDDGKWRNIARADVRDVVTPESLADWLDGRRALDAVIHMGAISATTERDADLIFDTNVRLTTRLWDWCSAQGTPFIYASSAATYGAGEHGFADDESPQALARLRPLNAYGWSKHFFDRRAVREVASGRAVPPQWVGLKFFNVYGPNEYHKRGMQSVVAQKYPAVARGEPVRLFKSHHPDYPDGGQCRDFVYVEDCVEVIAWLLDHPGVSGIYNLGSGRARSFADLARAIADAAGVPTRIEYEPTPEEIRANYQYFTEARMQKLRDAGYERPFSSIEDGVRRYVVQYLAKRDPYR
jgi:ADP-L-glycero-D-manno-heptose 6-epimerase